MKDYIQLGLDKGLISFNEDKSRITYTYQKKERNYNNPEEKVQAEKDLLKSLIDISERASQKWVYRVTIPSNKAKQHLVDYVDSAGNKIELKPENLLTGTSIFYSLVLSNLDNIW